jgi:hypothetical protein
LSGQPERRDIPTFAECVVGYRAWRADSEGLLWPLYSRRDPWLPGINTARCSRSWSRRLALRWLWGEREQPVFGAPAHKAPDQSCACGLYSWRRPSERWFEHPALCTPPRVVGAVASWGRIQVHADGFRAEHACVVAISYPDRRPEALIALEPIAARYRADVVPLSDLERTATRHGAPLPETVHGAVAGQG